MSARSVADVLPLAESYLADQGCESARLDAGLLLAHALSTERIQLYIHHERPLSEDELSAFRALTRRRARGEPVAYLVGEKEFWSMALRVDPRVLIPRPDTETLVEVAREIHASTPPARFVDAGTGSGCLACALAALFPTSDGVAIDSDPDALEVARVNVERHGFADRISLRQGHLLEPLADEGAELICANLPYIPTAALGELPRDIRLFEPMSALDGGEDGLDVIRALVEQAPAVLEPGGTLILEVGEGQADAVYRLCLGAGLVETGARRDLAGIERVIVAKRSGM